MKEFVTRAFALTFAARIHDWLREPKVIGMGTPYRTYHDVVSCHTSYYRTEGQLALCTHGESGETIVPVKVLIDQDWMMQPPKAFCSANFIRKEIDWHIQSDGSLCHVLVEQWNWEFNRWWEEGMEISQLMDRAASWSCQNIDSLITRHLHGHRLGLSVWPQKWSQWSHYQQGVIEFKKSLQKSRIAA